MHGVLNIDKPPGITSHDVVLQVRRLVGEKRAGHTGTLDPSATGVLVVCIGKATRIARYLEAGEKEYRAVIRLGIITDTLDADGSIIETRQYVPPGRAQIAAALKSFTGTVLQRPPAYSAVKVRGVPSYKLARQGKAQPLQPRPVVIHGIDLVRHDDTTIEIVVRCSKGVYIRTLCADIGEALGSGAHLSNLVRTRSGDFRLENAVTLDALSCLTPESMKTVLLSMDKALAGIPSITVSDDEARKISQGNRIFRPAGVTGGQDGLLRIHDQAGVFVALARLREGEIRPETVFM